MRFFLASSVTLTSASNCERISYFATSKKAGSSSSAFFYRCYDDHSKRRPGRRSSHQVTTAMSAPPEHTYDLSNDALTVFSGSSPEDVSHARQLWNSLCMPTPFESRLVSADIPQRLPVSRPERSGHSEPRRIEPPNLNAAQQREEERKRYLAMAAQRKETLALLRRQREQRIQKELLSAAFKPKTPRDKAPKENTNELEMEKEMVSQLD